MIPPPSASSTLGLQAARTSRHLQDQSRPTDGTWPKSKGSAGLAGGPSLLPMPRGRLQRRHSSNGRTRSRRPLIWGAGPRTSGRGDLAPK
jgi:hypothetical protein